MLKAVLFDMDGVIVDTEPLHHKAYHKMFSDFGIEVSAELYESFTGKSTRNVCKFLCNHFNLNEDPINLENRKRSHFNELFDYDESLQLLDGVLELIQDYHANGLTLILASSATMSTINRVFKRFDLDQYFKAKLSGADLKASKPHPEIFIKAAEFSGYNKQDCMVVEDSTNGIVAANSANIFCVAYKSEHSKNQDYSLANLVIEDFSEISFKKIENLQLA
ncbi:HAD family phosphatase [Mangrovimonas sp. YM274]|uniref:HAD family hydrolase n=1 Tax=Mangrovimonas sp. YM274 TaxID=3070660 RepID=UPI0027DAEE4A|nr:HAD family phosphatase [Mangrovimonas sp. YM274]WMI70366.1 HAD family phosphatase [Mangrovimonas sp. YM274]